MTSDRAETPDTHPRPVILILAGGRATRMGGGDKALVPFGAATLLDHVISRVSRQRPHRVVLNANGDPRRLLRFGLPVVADTVPDYPGPLAGVLAGMEWALAQAPIAVDVLTVPTDTPFVPLDLVDRLIAARAEAGAEMAFASSAGRVHPVVGLWPVRVAKLLRHALIDENIRRADRWTARFNLVHVPFSVDRVDPFFNINTRDDLAEAEKWVTGSSYPG